MTTTRDLHETLGYLKIPGPSLPPSPHGYSLPWVVLWAGARGGSGLHDGTNAVADRARQSVRWPLGRAEGEGRTGPRPPTQALRALRICARPPAFLFPFYKQVSLPEIRQLFI